MANYINPLNQPSLLQILAELRLPVRFFLNAVVPVVVGVHGVILDNPGIDTVQDNPEDVGIDRLHLVNAVLHH